MTDVSGDRAAMFVPNIGADNRNPTGLGFWSLVREDFNANDADFFSQGFWALFWHRFGNWRMGLPKLLRIPATVIYRIMFKMCEWICGIHLPYTVKVGRRVRLDHFGGMILVAQSIGDDVIIRQNTTFGISDTDDLRAWPIIGDRVHIGAGAVIVGKVFVGDDAIVGANAVVVRDVQPGQKVGGVPARPIGSGRA
jgi:serine O-acetyltransferase